MTGRRDGRRSRRPPWPCMRCPRSQPTHPRRRSVLCVRAKDTANVKDEPAGPVAEPKRGGRHAGGHCATHRSSILLCNKMQCDVPPDDSPSWVSAAANDTCVAGRQSARAGKQRQLFLIKCGPSIRRSWRWRRWCRWRGTAQPRQQIGGGRSGSGLPRRRRQHAQRLLAGRRRKLQPPKAAAATARSWRGCLAHAPKE